MVQNPLGTKLILIVPQHPCKMSFQQIKSVCFENLFCIQLILKALDYMTKASPLRRRLAPLEEERGTFRGEFERFGSKKGNRSQHTILLKNIKDENDESMCGHCWLNVGKRIRDLGHLRKGDRIQFDGRVKKYRKGSKKRGIPVRYDYKFTYPSKVQRI